MSERQRIFASMLVLIVSCMIVALVSINMLYHTAIREQKARLVDTAISRARVIEAVAAHDAAFWEALPKDQRVDNPFTTTLNQFKTAHDKFKGFGDTGEFTMARRENDQIVFLLRHRHANVEVPEPVPFSSELAEPMRRALNGESGTVTGLDYRGETVLAAYEPIGNLGLGIVAKIDMREVRAPFFSTGVTVTVIVIFIVAAGVFTISRISNPIIHSLETHSLDLEQEIEERKRAEKEIRKFQTSADRAAHGVAIVDVQGNVLYVNEAFSAMHGYSCDELLGKNMSIFHTQDQMTRVNNLNEHMGSQGFYTAEEVWHVTKGGKVFPTLMNGTLIKDDDGRPLFMTATAVDITEKKHMQDELKKHHDQLEELVNERTRELTQANLSLEESREQMRALSQQLISVQEQERQRLSHELHDQMGTTMTAISLELEFLLEQLTENDDDDSLSRLSGLVSAGTNELRRIVKGLRPLELDDIGLKTGIESLLKKFSSYTPLAVNLDADLLDEVKLPDEYNISLYRIVQEALNNVSKHAHAQHVSVTAEKQNCWLVLSILDDGKGFVPEQKEGLGRFGLLGMAERARLIGGEFDIQSDDGQGTRVVVRVPLESV